MRILHVITRLIAGGAQHNTVRTVVLHRSRGVAAEILTGPSDSEREGDLATTARDAGVPVHQLATLVREPYPRRDLAALLGLVRFLRRHPFDLVHTHTSKAGFLGRMAARLTGVPALIHTPHGHVFHSYYGPLLTRLYIILERSAAVVTDRLIALTPRERDEHLELGIGDRGQFLVVPSGIDIDRFQAACGRRTEARRDLGLPPGDFAIGCIGRLVAVKGQDVLLRALRPLLAQVPSARLLLAGDGHERERLLDLTAALGVGDRIRFLGRTDRPETLLAALDVLAVPSRNEGMGRVVLEAMAAEVPVVASRVGGIPDLVRDGDTGLLVPADDPEALAAAVARLARDPGLARSLAAAAAISVDTDYGEQAMADRLLELYHALLGRRSRGGLTSP